MQSIAHTVKGPNKSLYALLSTPHSLKAQSTTSSRGALHIPRVAASEPSMRAAGTAASDLSAAESDTANVSYAPAIGALLTEEFPVDQVHMWG